MTISLMATDDKKRMMEQAVTVLSAPAVRYVMPCKKVTCGRHNGRFYSYPVILLPLSAIF